MVTLFDLYSLLDTALYQWVYAFAFLFWVYPITWPYKGKGYKKDSKLFGVPCTPLVRWATAFLQCKRLNPRPTHKFFDQRSTQTWGGWEGKLVNLEEREFVLKFDSSLTELDDMAIEGRNKQPPEKEESILLHFCDRLPHCQRNRLLRKVSQEKRPRAHLWTIVWQGNIRRKERPMQAPTVLNTPKKQQKICGERKCRHLRDH